jgi:hypothetical protein
MNIHKNLCERLYREVKAKLQNEFVSRGMTYRGSETSIWKLIDPTHEKTYFQLIAEEITHISFSATFNNMYLWRKMNETQTRESIHFQEDYLLFFIKFLGYNNTQEYINEDSSDLKGFFRLKNGGKILAIQPIFDANITQAEQLYKNKYPKGKHPRADEQTVNSKDTESLLEIIDLFRSFSQTSLQRVYDQEIIKTENDSYELNEAFLTISNLNCVFCIGFYSNYFFEWALAAHLYHFIEYIESPLRYRIRYYSETLCQDTWTDYYQSNDTFDSGFLLKLPIKFGQQTVDSYFICGIEDKSTRAITSYLCQHWKSIAQKRDFETNEAISQQPFIMVFKVNKSNLKEIYCEKVVCIGFNGK